MYVYRNLSGCLWCGWPYSGEQLTSVSGADQYVLMKLKEIAGGRPYLAKLGCSAAGSRDANAGCRMRSRRGAVSSGHCQKVWYVSPLGDPHSGHALDVAKARCLRWAVHMLPRWRWRRKFAFLISSNWRRRPGWVLANLRWAWS